jgi:hypothetical protein
MKITKMKRLDLGKMQKSFPLRRFFLIKKCWCLRFLIFLKKSTFIFIFSEFFIIISLVTLGWILFGGNLCVNGQAYSEILFFEKSLFWNIWPPFHQSLRRATWPNKSPSAHSPSLSPCPTAHDLSEMWKRIGPSLAPLCLPATPPAAAATKQERSAVSSPPRPSSPLSAAPPCLPLSLSSLSLPVSRGQYHPVLAPSSTQYFSDLLSVEVNFICIWIIYYLKYAMDAIDLFGLLGNAVGISFKKNWKIV